jgi:hypothetical protein
MKYRSITLAALATLAMTPAFAQDAVPKLFFEGDVVRSAVGAQGAPCVLNNQFKRGEVAVFRVRLLDPRSGKPLDASGVKSLHVELSNGEKAPMSYHQHPPKDATDFFWSGGFPISENLPTGSLTYTVVATTLDGQAVKWKPFNVASSQITVLAK